MTVSSRVILKSRRARPFFARHPWVFDTSVDRYDRWLVAQFTSLALYHRRELVLRLLGELTHAEGILARAERGIAPREGLRAGEETIVGALSDGPVEVVENGLRYRVDLRTG